MLVYSSSFFQVRQMVDRTLDFAESRSVACLHLG